MQSQQAKQRFPMKATACSLGLLLLSYAPILPYFQNLNKATPEKAVRQYLLIGILPHKILINKDKTTNKISDISRIISNFAPNLILKKRMKTFEELGVSPEIRKAIEEMGYVSPMPVQEEVIPYLLGNGNDVVALAQTGTGKTAAFGLPLIQKTDVTRREPQALILCPTRELCLQIAGDLTDYSKYITDLKILPVYGGSSIESQIRSLKKGVHIIVATPGRLIDLMERKVAKLETIKDVVMDEADEMLNMGFTESINAILEHVPQDRNTLMFSATMSPEISKIAKTYLHDAKEISDPFHFVG